MFISPVLDCTNINKFCLFYVVCKKNIQNFVLFPCRLPGAHALQ